MGSNDRALIGDTVLPKYMHYWLRKNAQLCLPRLPALYTAGRCNNLMPCSA